MEAAGEEFVPAVDRRLLRLVHQDEFFHQTQAAGVVARLEGGGARQDPPLDVGLDHLVLEGPDVAKKYVLNYFKGSCTYYVITFGGPERPLPPYVIL